MIHRSTEVGFDTLGADGREIVFELPPAMVTTELNSRGCQDAAEKPLRAELHLSAVSGEVDLSGSIDGALVCTCVRCLEGFSQPIRSRFSLKIVRGGTRRNMEEEDELLKTGSEIDLETFDGENISLLPIVYEQLVLAIPLYPLCGEECRGLCPTCGENLNKGPCGCSGEKPVDPRLAALLHYKKPGG